MSTVVQGVVVQADQVAEGWVRIDDDRITDLGWGSAPAPYSDGEIVNVGDAWVMPGFVDQHCHGGGQGDFFSADFQQIATGIRTHLQQGTTSLVASLVTATTDDLIAQVQALNPFVEDGSLAGIHLEGPWISPHQCGAHDINLLRPPAIDELESILSVAHGHIKQVTIAPEWPGAMEAIRFLVSRDVVVSIGHTQADYDTTRAAIDAGATVATHLLNRMPPLDKREPGPVLALVEDERVVVEMIADGVHLHPQVIYHYLNVVGPDRVAIVTDAMGAAGAADGEYLIGLLKVTVADGVARLADSGALAGSTLTMARALQVLMSSTAVDVATASRILSTTPAQAMGLDDRGALAAGQRADLVVVNSRDYTLQRVMQAGRWV